MTLWLDARAAAPETLDAWLAARARRRALAAATGVEIALTTESRCDGATFDPDLRARLRRRRAPSCSAGPATTPGSSPPHVPAAMVLVRNATGVSHSPAEHVELEDAARGATLILSALELAHDRPPPSPPCPTPTATRSSATCAGSASGRPDPADDFWTWRTEMFRLARRARPGPMADVAGRVYREMVAAGYSAVGEFHYVHHQPDGTPYEQPNVMAMTVAEAARDAGLEIVLLPAAYHRNGWDGADRPPSRGSGASATRTSRPTWSASTACARGRRTAPAST